MTLLFKYISKELIKQKSMISVLFLFTVFISFMYFFVHFSIDKNMLITNEILGQNGNLSANEAKYYTALQNNQILIRNITVAMMSIFSIILFMFMKNFIHKNEMNIGYIMSMGFLEHDVMIALVFATICYSFIGSLFGLVFGYFGSSILIEANMETYLISGIVKGINIKTLVIGTLLTTAVFGIVTYITGIGMGRKDIALMIKHMDKKEPHPGLIAAMISRLPIKDKFKFKLTMKNISAVLFIVVAIITFNIMFVLSVSLFFSGKKIIETQTTNRDYTYDISYETYMTNNNQRETEDIYYLKEESTIKLEGDTLQYNIVGLDHTSSLFQLMDKNNKMIDIKKGIILNPELEENFGLKVGDDIHLIMEGKSYTIPVVASAENADLKTIYISKQQLAEMLDQNQMSYNGILSNRKPLDGVVTTFEDRIATIQRGLTSNKASAVINQSIGVIIGCLLIYLALLVGLNNNMKSILIFDLLGYSNLEVNKVLLNPYMIIINIFFWLTLPIGVYAARGIQIMTSIQTGDYMPFRINVVTVAYMLLILNMLCFLVRALFARKIKHIIYAERQAEFLQEW